MSTQVQSFLHDFPSWLKASLKAVHMSQSELSRATGITTGHISNIIHGRLNPSIKSVARIYDAIVEKAEKGGSV